MQQRMKKAVLIGLAGGISYVGVNYFINRNLSACIIGGITWIIVSVLLSCFFPKGNKNK